MTCQRMLRPAAIGSTSTRRWRHTQGCRRLALDKAYKVVDEVLAVAVESKSIVPVQTGSLSSGQSSNVGLTTSAYTTNTSRHCSCTMVTYRACWLLALVLARSAMVGRVPMMRVTTALPYAH